jgi:ABC-type transporter Mla MlaB component
VPLHNACVEQIRQGLGVLIDLTHCEHLDSTFLGTLLEVVDRADEAAAPLAIQGADAHVAALFAELGMDRVISRFTGRQIILPRGMAPLTAPAVGEEEYRRRMLMAHEALASLSKGNEQEFAHLIEHLRNEIQRLDARHVRVEPA